MSQYRVCCLLECCSCAAGRAGTARANRVIAIVHVNFLDLMLLLFGSRWVFFGEQLIPLRDPEPGNVIPMAQPLLKQLTNIFRENYFPWAGLDRRSGGAPVHFTVVWDRQ